jgi:GntR family transcriptional regulator
MTSDKDTKITDASNQIQDRINKGIYVAGQRLPSERDLADELEMSRVTIRAALLRLQTEGVIDIFPRSGTFVRSANAKALIGSGKPPISRGAELKQFGSFIRSMEAQGKATLIRFIEPSQIMAVGNVIGAKMGVSDTIRVLRRYRVHLVDRVPYRILDSYYLASLLGDLLGKDSGYIPLFKWLRDNKGVIAANAYERLNCRMPIQEEASLLNISRNQPVVDMERWVWANDDTLFEYSHIVANAALHEFSYSYEIEEEASK